MRNLEEGEEIEEEQEWEGEDNSRCVDVAEGTCYRALVARANYLALDRPDPQFFVKELCKAMSQPTIGDKKNLKRLGRYRPLSREKSLNLSWSSERNSWCWERQEFRGNPSPLAASHEAGEHVIAVLVAKHA